MRGSSGPATEEEGDVEPMREDDPRLKFMTVEEATKAPPGLINHMPDRWWVKHPTKGLVFYKIDRRDDVGRPQCNGQEAVTRDLVGRLYPWAEVVFVPSVFHRIRPQDYV